MRKRTRPLISTSVLVMMIGAIFFAGVPELSAQKVDGFVLYEFYVYCGDSGLPSAPGFTYEATEGGTEGRPLMGTHTFCVGNCGGDTGPVRLSDELAKLPAHAATGLQAMVDEYQANATAEKRLTCVGEGKKPPEDKKPDCRDIPCYCGWGPDKGFVFYNGPGGAHSEPSNNAPVVGKLPRGGRFVYHATTRSLTGDLWFGVAPPGIQGGGDPELQEPRIVWVPASALSCKRPTIPLQPRPSRMPDPDTRDKLAKPAECKNYDRMDPIGSCGWGLAGTGARG